MPSERGCLDNGAYIKADRGVADRKELASFPPTTSQQLQFLPASRFRLPRKRSCPDAFVPAASYTGYPALTRIISNGERESKRFGNWNARFERSVLRRWKSIHIGGNFEPGQMTIEERKWSFVRGNKDSRDTRAFFPVYARILLSAGSDSGYATQCGDIVTLSPPYTSSFAILQFTNCPAARSFEMSLFQSSSV